eukprot:2120053-Pyramimonas_sp.AAC.1
MATSASSKKEDPESLIKKCVDYSSNVLEEMSQTSDALICSIVPNRFLKIPGPSGGTTEAEHKKLRRSDPTRDSV